MFIHNLPKIFHWKISKLQTFKYCTPFMQINRFFKINMVVVHSLICICCIDYRTEDKMPCSIFSWISNLLVLNYGMSTHALWYKFRKQLLPRFYFYTFCKMTISLAHYHHHICKYFVDTHYRQFVSSVHTLYYCTGTSFYILKSCNSAPFYWFLYFMAVGWMFELYTTVCANVQYCIV